MPQPERKVVATLKSLTWNDKIGMTIACVHFETPGGAELFTSRFPIRHDATEGACRMLGKPCTDFLVAAQGAALLKAFKSDADAQ